MSLTHQATFCEGLFHKMHHTLYVCMYIAGVM